MCKTTPMGILVSCGAVDESVPSFLKMTEAVPAARELRYSSARSCSRSMEGCVDPVLLLTELTLSLREATLSWYQLESASNASLKKPLMEFLDRSVP